MLSMELLTWITTFTLIILCELGDKTQVAVLLLASNNPAKRWLIMAASAAALTTCVLLEVTFGTLIARHISPGMINKGTGVVFLLIGIITLAGQAGVIHKARIKKIKTQQHDLSVLKS